MTDPQYETDRAKRELARRLRGYLADPDALAGAYVDDLLAAGWRPPLRPPDPFTRPGRVDPAVTARGAAAARAALTQRGNHG